VCEETLSFQNAHNAQEWGEKRNSKVSSTKRIMENESKLQNARFGYVRPTARHPHEMQS
jgi:hypothetical protein